MCVFVCVRSRLLASITSFPGPLTSRSKFAELEALFKARFEDLALDDDRRLLWSMVHSLNKQSDSNAFVRLMSGEALQDNSPGISLDASDDFLVRLERLLLRNELQQAVDLALQVHHHHHRHHHHHHHGVRSIVSSGMRFCCRTALMRRVGTSCSNAWWARLPLSCPTATPCVRATSP